MSTISGVSGTSSAWPQTPSAGAGSRAARLFAKVDADASGSVDTTELQGMLDHIAAKTGNTAGKAEDVLKTMDSDGDGSLNQDELDAGMKSLMPPPSSTVEFAERSGGPDGCPPPPPGDDSSASASTDPLDSNGDGTVSAAERAAGAVKNVMEDLFEAIDSDGDQSISKSEYAAFKQKLEAMFDTASTASASTGTTVSVTA